MRVAQLRRLPELVSIAILITVFAASTAAQTFAVFDIPGATAIYPLAINNGGEVTGTWTNGVQGGGFVRDRNGNITTFDGWPCCMNNRGDVVGTLLPSGHTHSFLRDRNGKITVFDIIVPKSDAIGPGSPKAINDGGDIAGQFVYGADIGCFVREANGNVTVIEAGSWNPFRLGAGECFSISNAGDVTGSAGPLSQGSLGFVFYRNGDFISFNPPYWVGPESHVGVQSVSINAHGDVAGYYYWYDKREGRYRGFIRDRQGEFTVFDAPDATNTYAVSINARGDVTGSFESTTGTHGFVRDRKGNFAVFDAYPRSINEAGDITGSFWDANGTHGFVRTAH